MLKKLDVGRKFMTKQYKASDLNVHEYGRGHKKLFIMYTDYNYDPVYGPRHSTRVYPDVQGNKANAIKEALDWLNNTERGVGEPWVIRNSPKKIQIVYQWGW